MRGARQLDSGCAASKPDSRISGPSLTPSSSGWEGPLLRAHDLGRLLGRQMVCAHRHTAVAERRRRLISSGSSGGSGGRCRERQAEFRR